jgi:hypothetical protein
LFSLRPSLSYLIRTPSLHCLISSDLCGGRCRHEARGQVPRKLLDCPYWGRETNRDETRWQVASAYTVFLPATEAPKPHGTVAFGRGDAKSSVILFGLDERTWRQTHALARHPNHCYRRLGREGVAAAAPTQGKEERRGRGWRRGLPGRRRTHYLCSTPASLLVNEDGGEPWPHWRAPAASRQAREAPDPQCSSRRRWELRGRVRPHSRGGAGELAMDCGRLSRGG